MNRHVMPTVTVEYHYIQMEKFRRRCMRGIVRLFILMVLMIVPVRLSIDSLLDNNMLKEMQHLRKFAILVPLSFFIPIAIFGFIGAFARDYPMPIHFIQEDAKRRTAFFMGFRRGLRQYGPWAIGLMIVGLAAFYGQEEIKAIWRDVVDLIGK